MSKKNFARGIESLLEPSASYKEEKIKETSEEFKQKPRIDNLPGKGSEIRTSITIDTDVLEQMRAIAYWERKPLKDIWIGALNDYFASKGNKVITDALKQYRENVSSKEK